MADEPGPILDLQTGTYASPWGQCLNGICETLIDLDLPEIEGNVWIRDPPTIEGIPLPCILISPFTPSHSPQDGTVTAPDLVYRAMIAVVKAGARTVNVTLPERLYWYHRVFKAFAKQSNPFVLETPGRDGVQLLYATIEPGDPSVVEAWEVSFDAIWLAVACHCRYPSTA